jgi:hypothetical protein
MSNEAGLHFRLHFARKKALEKSLCKDPDKYSCSGFCNYEIQTGKPAKECFYFKKTLGFDGCRFPD